LEPSQKDPYAGTASIEIYGDQNEMLLGLLSGTGRVFLSDVSIGQTGRGKDFAIIDVCTCKLVERRV
jgi:hypothetical protein